ncbi:MAG: Rpn family recombination-promoting nuclease/putative transposase [Treponema sp.]|nr:Rpn family recombination-promoting nuclease/putative transposase [Treponema sp.]
MAATVIFNDSEDILDIRLDNVFKAVFTRDTPNSKTALSRLVSDITDRKMEVLNLTANEPAVENVRDRQMRFDINCVAENGELVNVEMSLNPRKFEPVRLEYHAAKLFAGQGIKGSDKTYDDLKPAYQIAILAKEEFFGDGDFFHSFEYHDPVRGVSLGGRTRIMTLELAKLAGVSRKPIDQMSNREQWAMFFQYLTDPKMRGIINAILKRKEDIAMAAEVLLTISRDEAERARLRSEEKNLLDIQSDMVFERREGRREGRKEGRDELSDELLSLISKGCTVEDLQKKLAGR